MNALLEIAGLAALTLAAFLLAVPLGLAVLGGALLWVSRSTA